MRCGVYLPVFRFQRFAAYTSKPTAAETAPLLGESVATTTKSSMGPKLGMMAKVAPTKPKINTTNMGAAAVTARSNEATPSTSRPNYSVINGGNRATTDERADNKKNENMEKRKKEEKLKLKAEKEARKVTIYWMYILFRNYVLLITRLLRTFVA